VTHGGAVGDLLRLNDVRVVPLDERDLQAPVVTAEERVAKSLVLVHFERRPFAVAKERVRARGALVFLRRDEDLPRVVGRHDRLARRVGHGDRREQCDQRREKEHGRERNRRYHAPE
jgi:hypothetical protein